MGSAPSAQPRGRSLNECRFRRKCRRGCHRALLERRPDIRAAEQNLIAANAEIGAARALFFPQLSLNAFAGAQTRALSQIASGPARVYTMAPSVILPIFHAGQIKKSGSFNRGTTAGAAGELRAIHNQRPSRSVRCADWLLANAIQRVEQQELVRAWMTPFDCRMLRYKGGLDSYLQVLDAQRNLFSGELGLAQLRVGGTSDRRSAVSCSRRWMAVIESKSVTSSSGSIS